MFQSYILFSSKEKLEFKSCSLMRSSFRFDEQNFSQAEERWAEAINLLPDTTHTVYGSALKYQEMIHIPVLQFMTNNSAENESDFVKTQYIIMDEENESDTHLCLKYLVPIKKLLCFLPLHYKN